MRTLTLILSLLTLAGTPIVPRVAAEGVSVAIQSRPEVDAGNLYKAKAVLTNLPSGAAVNVTWTLSPPVADLLTFNDGRDCATVIANPGKYQLKATAIIATVQSYEGKPQVGLSTAEAVHWLTVAGKKSPGPDEEKPRPKPDTEPDPPPIPNLAGLHILIIYEKDDTLPFRQDSIIHGERARNWMDAHTPTLGDGQHAWRIYDQNADLSGALDPWRKGMSRPRDALPWIIISNAKTGYEGPLPANVDAFLQLLERYK